jgi:hypothetical protein
MNEQLKNKLINIMYHDLVGNFSANDAVLYGCNFPGLYSMTDQQLLEEYESYIEDDDELLAEVRAEIAINNMLQK